MVGLWLEGFFDLGNFVSRSLRAHVSYGSIHAMSGLTVDSSANAKGGGGVKEVVSLHAHVFRRRMCHSVCQFEMSCLGYMYLIHVFHLTNRDQRGLRYMLLGSRFCSAEVPIQLNRD